MLITRHLILIKTDVLALNLPSINGYRPTVLKLKLFVLVFRVPRVILSKFGKTHFRASKDIFIVTEAIFVDLLRYPDYCRIDLICRRVSDYFY